MFSDERNEEWRSDGAARSAVGRRGQRENHRLSHREVQRELELLKVAISSLNMYNNSLCTSYFNPEIISMCSNYKKRFGIYFSRFSFHIPFMIYVQEIDRDGLLEE